MAAPRIVRAALAALLAIAFAAPARDARADHVYVDDPCSVRDVVTPYAAFGDHDLTVVDWTYRLPASYAPPDLVPASRAGFRGASGSKLVRDDLVADLAALRAAAAAAGHALEIRSAYRSYATQVATWNHWVAQVGVDAALRRSARPGHSEHQLGTTVDLTSGGIAPWSYADWGRTPAGAWMAANGPRFGFVLSYPRGATDRTCYDHEPWHWRWIGRHDAAAQVRSGLTLREYLEARLHARFVDIRFTLFEGDVTWLAERGITDGCGGGRFCPEAAVSRGEMASFLVRALGLTEGSSIDAFRDDDGTLHEASINRLAHAGITTGCGPDRFCPAAPVTRAEMASFLVRGLGLTEGSSIDAFRDDGASVHEPDINRLAHAGISDGCGAGRYCPSALVAREQMAAFLRRALA